MRSFVKIKPSRIGDVTLSFTDIGTCKSCPVRDFLRRKCVFQRYSRKLFSRENFRPYSIHATSHRLCQVLLDEVSFATMENNLIGTESNSHKIHNMRHLVFLRMFLIIDYL